MKKSKTAAPLRKSKHFSFLTAEKALAAYKQASAIVENKFFMEPGSLVSINDRVVTVPDWFPFKPADGWT